MRLLRTGRQLTPNQQFEEKVREDSSVHIRSSLHFRQAAVTQNVNRKDQNPVSSRARLNFRFHQNFVLRTAFFYLCLHLSPAKGDTIFEFFDRTGAYFSRAMYGEGGGIAIPV